MTKTSAQRLYTALEKNLKTYLDADAITQVEKAFQYSLQSHEGQLRQSGKPYITHPLEVAKILAGLKQDVTTIVASLLHDTLEDTAATVDTIRDQFGQDVIQLVEGVTKLGKIYFGTSVEAQAENYRKMFLAMAEDFRVVIIKLADRLHNMRTLKFVSKEKQQRVAKETMDIFAPLAHRLGMGTIKWELEDLAFLYLDPKGYKLIKKMVAANREEREKYINVFTGRVEKLLKGIEGSISVSGRLKHFYSIHQKLEKSGMTYDELFDIRGIRIVTKTVQDCYEILGVIHSAYKPVAGRIKDYIAMPKTNMYQSLHTSVIGPGGKPVEIQIRTDDMHQIAEYGIAAHWRYKGDTDAKPYQGKFAWLQQILASQKEEPTTFIQNLKIDLFSDEVFVYTPKGDVQVLPKGSTPVDFAYKVHTEVGNCCVGANVNGHIVPLHYVLRNGDQISIMTSKQANPKLGWLDYVKTRQAKTNIKTWFRRQSADVNREKGKRELEKSVLAAGYSESEALTDTVLAKFIEEHATKNKEELYLLIAYGDISSTSVVRYLDQHFGKERPPQDAKVLEQFPVKKETKKAVQGIRVLGEDNIQTNLARCCNPLPGDDVIGYITMGFGVSVHRSECPNILRVPDKDKGRIIAVEWKGATDLARYPVHLQVEGFDREGLLNEVMSRLLDGQANIREIKSRQVKDGQLIITIQMDLQNINQLQSLKEVLGNIPDVLSVYRPRSA